MLGEHEAETCDSARGIAAVHLEKPRWRKDRLRGPFPDKAEDGLDIWLPQNQLPVSQPGLPKGEADVSENLADRLP
ncbi:hypothetical protein [Pseudoroseomonas cervicalis]|uniref:hypothetical protein n=1 Tax=Teichococcus cervicalis TaxID=204525 RepID=UPI0022F17113|nr:hypothetical protein [Pseudoroseomonas cervicalis]WBV41597.1 hypothetical protein PFY06_10100 [Pseudoroseomonas cervicalis]